MDATVENVSDSTGMIAVQGPKAIGIVQRLVDAVADRRRTFRDLAALRRDDVKCWVEPVIVGRTGYTGEDGVELYRRSQRGAPLAETAGDWPPDGLVPIGLGARDTLRLEAKMALYGHELTEEINPLEAALSWAVSFDKGDFIGKMPYRRSRTPVAPHGGSLAQDGRPWHSARGLSRCCER